MKSLVVDTSPGSALAGRVQTALDLARAHDAHVTCHYTIPFPLVPSYEPFGGVANMTPILNDLHRQEVEARQSMEATLEHEDVRWDWSSRSGDTGNCLVEASALADLVLISQDGQDSPSSGYIDYLLTHSASPVMVLPKGCGRIDPLGPVMIAWNGSVQVARTIRQTMAILNMAAKVHLVSIGEDAEPVPLTEAGAYLSRHGVNAELHTAWATKAGAAEQLLGLARAYGASAIIMGAYGHSRLRETILGGVTRDLTRRSEIPLILGH